MTPKMMERLSRLEASRPEGSGSTPMPPWLAGTLLKAIAIGLGGYSQPPKPAPLFFSDTLGDGFARGLGYIDQADMETRAEADPDECRGRMRAAEQAMSARYIKGQDSDNFGQFVQILRGALDEVCHAKAAKLPGVPHHWPSTEPRFDATTRGIREALALFGVTSEEQIMEAVGP